MSARRKKQRRIRDLRTLVGVGRITRDEAQAIGSAHGLGKFDTNVRRRQRMPARRWAIEQSNEAMRNR